MMVRTCLVLASILGLAAAVSPGAAAAERTVYQGELGAAGAVVMELEPRDAGTYTGRYFYQRYGVDIPLEGPPGALAEAIPLTEIDGLPRAPAPVFVAPDADAPRVVWNGTLSEAGYSGTWTDAESGRRLPFTLQAVATYDPEAIRDAVRAGHENVTILRGAGPASGLGREPGHISGLGFFVPITPQAAPYEYLKLSAMAVGAGPESGGPESVSDEVAYAPVTEPRTGVPSVRLTRHPDPEAMAAVNALLEQRHWRMVLGALECRGEMYWLDHPAAGTFGEYDNEQVRVAYLSPTLMTVVESGSLYCGGAHPTNHWNQVTFDLLEGVYLDIDRIVDAFTVGEGGDRRPSPALLDLIAHHAGQVARDSDTDHHCEDELADYLSLSFAAPDRLVLGISGIPHALGYCLGPQLEIPVRPGQPPFKPDADRYFRWAR